MANKFAKDFSDNTNHDFGSFAPKEVHSKNKTDVGGSKGSSDVQNASVPANDGNVSSANNISNEALNKMTQGKALNASLMAKQKLNDVFPINDIKQGVKADLKASATGEDPDAVLQEEKEKENDPSTTVANKLKNQANKVITNGVAPKGAGVTAGNRFTGALGALKGAGLNIIGTMKGAFATIGLGIGKAGAAVGTFFHTSATVGTVIVLSGTVAATSIPVLGGAGYFINQHTQRTDGCIPEEYDDKSSSGADAALEWALKIANDDSFNYGVRHTYGGYASAPGCYFCGTNDGKVRRSGGDTRYYKTYVCMTFVTAAYAHGAKDPDALKICESCQSFDSHDGVFEQVPAFHKVGLMRDLTVDDLKPGDVLVHYASDNDSGHMSMYAGNGDIVDSAIADPVGGWSPESIALRKGKAESYLKGTWNSEPEKNFVMRYKGGGHSLAVASEHANSAFSTVAARPCIQASIEWARAIAADDRFTYGQGYGSWYDCPVCHKCTDTSDMEYTCNPFVAAAFAHGTGDPLLMNNGNHKVRTSDWNFEGERAKIWKKVGLCKDLSWSDVEPGDILIEYAAGKGGHAWLYGGGDEIIEATSGAGIVDKQTGAESRFHKYQTRSQDFVMRYIGDGSGGTSPLFGSSDYNEEVAAMTADDGCGGEMDGAQDSGAYIGKGMKKITAANGEEYIILDFDLEAVKKLGHQGDKQCYQYSIAYCDLILGGKFRCNASSSTIKTTYGDGGVNGVPSKIGGDGRDVGSTDKMVETCIKEIKQGRPAIVHVQGESYGVGTDGHFVCVCGWTANAGSDISWDELVCCDPAYFYKKGDDGLHALKGFSNYGDNWVTTFENWTPAKGQKKRSN